MIKRDYIPPLEAWCMVSWLVHSPLDQVVQGLALDGDIVPGCALEQSPLPSLPLSTQMYTGNFHAEGNPAMH